MIRRTPISTLTHTLFPYTTLFRSYAFQTGQLLRRALAADGFILRQRRDGNLATRFSQSGYIDRRDCGGQVARIGGDGGAALAFQRKGSVVRASTCAYLAVPSARLERRGYTEPTLHQTPQTITQ